MNEGQLTLARTSGESASTHTSKRGCTDDEHNGRGKKRACRVSLSCLFYESGNEAVPLPG